MVLMAANSRATKVHALDILRGIFSPEAGPLAGVLEGNGITAAQVDAAIQQL